MEANTNKKIFPKNSANSTVIIIKRVFTFFLSCRSMPILIAIEEVCNNMLEYIPQEEDRKKFRLENKAEHVILLYRPIFMKLRARLKHNKNAVL